MSITEELERLSKLKADGLMTEEEFSQAKAKLLASTDGEASGKPSLEKNGGAGEPAQSSSNPAPQASSNPLDNLNFDTNQWAMFIHLGQLAFFIFPLAGAAVPIILWQIKKDESEIIDRHGKMVTNWILSLAIYSAASVVLSFVVIGFFTGFRRDRSRRRLRCHWRDEGEGRNFLGVPADDQVHQVASPAAATLDVNEQDNHPPHENPTREGEKKRPPF